MAACFAVRAEDRAAGDPARGRSLFYDRMRCVACHVTEVEGKKIGGILGPDLSRVAERYGPADLAKIIIAPPGEIMPQHYGENMNATELQDLVGFLMTLQGNEPPPPSKASAVERGKWLYRRKGCFVCHGESGMGGVPNYNYVKETVPALNAMADRMMITSREDADSIIQKLEQGADLEALVDDPPIPRYNVFLAQYNAIRGLIRNGNRSGKKNPEGPQPPLSMPAWKHKLSDGDIDDMLAYLLTLQHWED